MSDYYFVEVNGHLEVKNVGKWHITNKQYDVLYNKTSFSFQTEYGIS